MSLHTEMIADMTAIEADLGNPSFVWQGNVYTCIASLTQIIRDLGDGGFRVNQLSTIQLGTINWQVIFIFFDQKKYVLGASR